MADSKIPAENESKPSFLSRIPVAFSAFFRTLADADFASEVISLRKASEQTASTPSSTQEPEKTAGTQFSEVRPDAALQLLSLMQRDARLIDFSMENLTSYSDAEIGAAARVVHEGCRKVLNEHFTIEPVRPETEGSSITLNEGFDAAAIRLTGNVVGKAPFRGNLTHRGWRASDVRLPKMAETHDASILAPAEVEL